MIKISFIGDVMCELETLRRMRSHGNLDFSSFFSSMSGCFSKSDYVVGNLETVFGGKAAGFTSDLYSFNTPDELADSLGSSGIDFFSTANNHCLDRGMSGLARTLDVLDAVGIPHTGTYRNLSESEQIAVATIQDAKVAFIACTGSTNYSEGRYKLSDEELCSIDLLHPQDMQFYHRPNNHFSGIKKAMGSLLSAERKVQLKRFLGKPVNAPRVDDMFDPEAVDEYMGRIKSKIIRAKSMADYVVVLPHIGGQFNADPGACANYIVSRLCDFGADAVIASHPHVVQKVEMRGSVPVAFSVGNYSMSPNSIYLLHELKPEYGIMLHLYLGNGALKKVSFSILKILEDDRLSVLPVDELYENTEAVLLKKALEEDAAFIYRRVLPDGPCFEGVQAEYAIWEA